MAPEGLRADLAAVARAPRRAVAGALDDARVDEVLVQVVDVLDEAVLALAADGDEVERGQVLDELASPVATATGATARAIAAWPRTSSGLVGSSIQVSPNGARRSIHAIASSTSQAWLASTLSCGASPSASRAIAQRRTSSSTSAPTFSLTCLKPSSSASATSRRSLSSS